MEILASRRILTIYRIMRKGEARKAKLAAKKNGKPAFAEMKYSPANPNWRSAFPMCKKGWAWVRAPLINQGEI